MTKNWSILKPLWSSILLKVAIKTVLMNRDNQYSSLYTCNHIHTAVLKHVPNHNHTYSNLVICRSFLLKELRMDVILSRGRANQKRLGLSKRDQPLFVNGVHSSISFCCYIVFLASRMQSSAAHALPGWRSSSLFNGPQNVLLCTWSRLRLSCKSNSPHSDDIRHCWWISIGLPFCFCELATLLGVYTFRSLLALCNLF